MGIALRNKIDLQLSLEARQMWNEDELFKSFFHNTGRVSLHQVPFSVVVVVVGKLNPWSVRKEYCKLSPFEQKAKRRIILEFSINSGPA